MAVPDETCPPIRQRDVPHAGQKRLGFQFARLSEERAGSGSQDLRQGTIDLVRLTKPDGIGIRVHGVSRSLRGPGTLDLLREGTRTRDLGGTATSTEVTEAILNALSPGKGPG